MLLHVAIEDRHLKRPDGEGTSILLYEAAVKRAKITACSWRCR